MYCLWADAWREQQGQEVGDPDDSSPDPTDHAGHDGQPAVPTEGVWTSVEADPASLSEGESSSVPVFSQSNLRCQ